MQFDGTLRLPDGKQIAIVLDVDREQWEKTSSQTGSAELIARSIEVFGSQEKALAWLRSSVPGLDDKRPLDVMDTVDGRARVDGILGMIEHGIFG